AFFVSFSSLPPPTPSLFPYTSLFRSGRDAPRFRALPDVVVAEEARRPRVGRGREQVVGRADLDDAPGAHHGHGVGDRERLDLVRSEEHTSELQSRENLVCRLLLEKKN